MPPPIGAPLPSLASGSHVVDFDSWSRLEWVGYSAMALVCVWVLWEAVRTTIRPNEDAPDHVKRSILDDDESKSPGRPSIPKPPSTPAAPRAAAAGPRP